MSRWRCCDVNGVGVLCGWRAVPTRARTSWSCSRGRSEWGSVWRHGFRNALLPLITLLGLSLPGLIGGSVILETVCAIPGMGRLFFDAVYGRDFTTIMGILTMGAVLTLVGNLLADVGYALADPRIRRQTEGSRA